MKQTMTRYPKSVALTLCLLLGIGLFVGCEQFGAILSGAYLDEVEASPHYDHDRDMFVNRRPDILDTMTVGQSFWQDPLVGTNQIFYLTVTKQCQMSPSQRSNIRA